MGQNVTNGPLLSKGEFSLEFVEVLDAETVVPVVTRDEGIMKIVIDESVEKYFTAQEVLTWIRNEQLRISMVEFRPGNVNLHADGSITIRFQFQFLPSQEMIARKVEIQNVRDFAIYYQSHDFYRSKINVYRLKVAKDPVRDAPKMATVTFRANQPGFSIDMFDASNILRRYDVPEYSATFSNIPPGRHSIQLAKNGYLNVSTERMFVGDSSYVVEAVFNPIELPNVPVIQPARRNRWWLWTLLGVAATSSTAYFLLQPGSTPRLPGPPGPPTSN